MFVVTHQPPDESPEGGVYEFVTDGIEAALERAQAAAGERVVVVMGGGAAQTSLCAGTISRM